MADLVVGFGLVDSGIPGEESRVFYSLADFNVVPTVLSAGHATYHS